MNGEDPVIRLFFYFIFCCGNELLDRGLDVLCQCRKLANEALQLADTLHLLLEILDFSESRLVNGADFLGDVGLLLTPFLDHEPLHCGFQVGG